MVSLETLNKQAREQAVSLDQVDWERPIDATKLWVPPELCPLAYLPIHGELSEAEALSANHIYALSLAEQFIFLETDILNNVVQALQRDSSLLSFIEAEPGLGEAMQHLFDEEEVHAEMFWRLCEGAAPEHYPPRRLRLVPITRFRRWLVRSIFERPKRFPFWCWVGALFEEKTIYFSRLYEGYGAAEMDQTFARVHRLHMLDEARHFALEREFVRLFWRNLSAPSRALNLRLFQGFLGSFVNPRESTLRRFDVLCQEHPRLSPLRARLKEELRGIHQNTAWRAASFSREVLPGCFRMFDEHSDIAEALAAI